MEDGKELGDGNREAGVQDVESEQIHLKNAVESNGEETNREALETDVGDGEKKIGEEEERKEEAKGDIVDENRSDDMEVQLEVIDEKKEIQQAETVESEFFEANQEFEAEEWGSDHAIQPSELVGGEEEVELPEAVDANGVPGVEEPDVKEQVQNRDADAQIEDITDGKNEQPHTEDVEMGVAKAELPSSVEEKETGIEGEKLPAVVEYPREVIGTEGIGGDTVTADITQPNAKNKTDGDNLEASNEAELETPHQLNSLALPSNEDETVDHQSNGMSEVDGNSEKVMGVLSNDKFGENELITTELHGKEIQDKQKEPLTYAIKEEDATEEANEQRLNSAKLFLDGDDSGTPEEQASFIRELTIFFKERGTDFRAPKFYGDPLNLLKLWRAVVRLGGYEQVTSCKLWRQVGESFNPPKTCTTISYAFRLFYEKALLDFEKHKMQDGDVPHEDLLAGLVGETQSGGSRGPGTGRVRRDSAARAMQGWHQQRVLGDGEVGDPIIKALQEKNSNSLQKREKLTKSINSGSVKRKTLSHGERPSKLIRSNSSRPQLEISVVDVGIPADWVKVNVRKTKDCFEIYALVPGLLREEVRVQSDPAGRLVISGEPEQLDNPWGVTPFKKVVSLPTRIDPHHTSAVVTLHGQLFVRVPFEPTDG